MIAACGLLIGTSALQGCKDDYTLTGQPSWLGNSIYERLEEDGNYKTMLKLIDDLGQHEVLSHTGSKTLFAANDAAFQEWFKNLANDSFGFLSAITGGSFEKMSIFALSITPYITSSIIIQLLTIAIPALGELQQDGEDGRKKLAAITRYVTVALAVPVTSFLSGSLPVAVTVLSILPASTSA